MSRLMFSEELGVIIRTIRIQRGYSLRKLSLKSNMSFAYLSEVERGLNEPSSAIISSIAAGLSVPLSLIIAETAKRILMFENIGEVPDTVPEDFFIKNDRRK